MDKVIETRGDYRILQSTTFNFETGATRKFYRVQRLQDKQIIVKRWYRVKIETIKAWEFVTGPGAWFTPHVFKSKKIAQKYIKYQEKNTIKIILSPENAKGEIGKAIKELRSMGKKRKNWLPPRK